jgi:ABC-2 type transport system ATP-binding protein
MTVALRIQSLKKTYSTGVEALKGVSIDVPAGDFFALLGPNGAGKSTLISIVAGLTNKTFGTVKVFDTDIDQDIDKAKSYIGLVPQEMNFNIFEKVIDIVVTQAGYYGVPRSVAIKDAEEILKQLGLWEKKDAKAMTLSGGMKRRLMIARALIHRPRMLILDEPTAGVDIELRRGMWEYLQTLTKQGITIILTTHYLEEAEQLAKDMAIIDRGEIVSYGKVKELLRGLDQETFVLDLAAPYSGTVKDTGSFSVVKRDDQTLELSIVSTDNLTDALISLKAAGVVVKSMRPKSNRLEELFVRLTKKS